MEIALTALIIMTGIFFTAVTLKGMSLYANDSRRSSHSEKK